MHRIPQCQERLICCTDEKLFFLSKAALFQWIIFNDRCLHLTGLAECTSLYSGKLETSYNTCFTLEELNNKMPVTWLKSHKKNKKENKIEHNFPKNLWGAPWHCCSRVTASSICRFGMYLWLWKASFLICKNKCNLEKYLCWYKEFIIYVKMQHLWSRRHACHY